MNKLVIKDTVDTQYKSPDKLNVRIRLHQLYSTNTEGFNNWILKHYDIKKESSTLLRMAKIVLNHSSIRC